MEELKKYKEQKYQERIEKCCEAIKKSMFATIDIEPWTEKFIINYGECLLSGQIEDDVLYRFQEEGFKANVYQTYDRTTGCPTPKKQGIIIALPS